jgi:glutamine phosphoribosylpyrophosphate amidotransferase
MGEQLAKKIRGIPKRSDIDVVIPIPDSSRPSALELANNLRPQVSRGIRQEPLHRPHSSSCRDRRCARKACGRS